MLYEVITVSEIVNALLTELDGIKNNLGIVTIAATNNPEMLDNAVRSRFEEEIEFKMPDDNERLNRITSYNVCYTKLLRFSLKNSFILRI